MKRRQLLTGLGAGTLFSGASLSARAQTQQRFNWRLVTTWPPNFPIFQETVRRFADDVKRMSGGRLNIQAFAGGELVPALQTFDAVSQGTVEMGHGAAYYWAGKIPAAQFFTAVPFGMNAQGMNAWLYSGGGLELWREVYAPHGLVPFPMGNTGVQMAGWFRKRIESLADLKGLKMRIPGLGGKVIARAGVNPVLLAGSEIYTALERGTVDAAEWVGPFHDLRLGLYRAARHYYYPGWQEPGPVMEMIINKRAWESLPEDLQRIVETAAQASNVLMLAEFETRNIEALETLKTRYKVEVLALPTDVIAELRRLTQLTLEEEAKSDPIFKKVWEHQRAFMQTNDAWGRISEIAYARTRA
ncbi:MAG: TRAP transporter substrate-binding protein [Chromatiales bacterium]|jgi:TRAP-type mannitol/chloroaromatic compound transport system substrate-binding protein|nr:TRAP transporter substrate-binding protein [Chromatiales bacterium]